MSNQVKEILIELVRRIGYDYYKKSYDLEMKHIDQALSKLAEMVRERKKGRKIYFGEDCTSDKVKVYNQALEDLAKEIERIE